MGKAEGFPAQIHCNVRAKLRFLVHQRLEIGLQLMFMPMLGPHEILLCFMITQ